MLLLYIDTFRNTQTKQRPISSRIGITSDTGDTDDSRKRLQKKLKTVVVTNLIHSTRTRTRWKLNCFILFRV